MDERSSRLELDEQGRPLDRDASSPTELVSHGTDQAPVIERLVDRLRRSVAWSYLSQHRVETLALAGVLVTTVAAATYVLTRPPTTDPVVQVRLRLTAAAGAGVAAGCSSAEKVLRCGGSPEAGLVSGRALAQANYAADTTEEPTSIIDVVGILGPGLTEPTASGEHLEVGRSVPVSVTATIDCTDSRWADATDDAYRVQVVRTDAYERVTAYDAPLGPSAADWRARVQRECLLRTVAQLPVERWTTTAVPGQPVMRLSALVRNPNGFPVWLEPEVEQWSLPAAGAAQAVVLPGATTTLTVALLLTDCADDAWGLPGFPGGGPPQPYVAYFPVRAGLRPLSPAVPTPDQHFDPQLAMLPIQASRAVSLLAGLRRACDGIPLVTSAVTDVAPLPSPGRAAGWRIGLVIRGRADSFDFGWRALVASGTTDFRSVPSFDDPALGLPGRTTTHGAAAVTASVTWRLTDCQDVGLLGPPQFLVKVAVSERTYPVKVTLADARLLAQLRAACGGQPASNTTAELGWTVS